MLKVFIVGGHASQYVQMYLAAGWDVCKDLRKADLIQFTGGEDVSPCLYGEYQHRTTGNDFDRDLFEAAYFAIARRMGIPMVGICRGGQFLNVMSGGSMYQHVSKHATGLNHILLDHQDLMRPKAIEVSSTHHQMMRCGPTGQVIATAELGGFKEYVKDREVVRAPEGEADTEVVWYADTGCLCFQPHPEFFDKGHPCFEYFFDLLQRFHGLRA